MAFAQGYPVPAKTPNTPVTCATCGSNGGPGMTVGYTAPITTFTGRFLDSSNTTEWFRPFRTARANQVMIMPGLNRIYFRYGDGAVVAYTLSTFFSRLEAGETLTFPYRPVPGDRSGNPEQFLSWDSWFNPELASPNWQITNGDGQVRMPNFDVDDKGYVYVASTVYGWGIVKDGLGTGGATMNSMMQMFPGPASPNGILALQANGHYYAYMGPAAQPLWDVTNRASYVFNATSSPKPIAINAGVAPLAGAFARNAAADHFATVNGGILKIYDVGSFVGGAAAAFTGTGYTQVASDGTYFYALKPTAPGMASLDVFSTTGTLMASNPIAVMSDTPRSFRVGDNYLVMTGLDGGVWDARVYRLNASFVPTAIPLGTSLRVGDTMPANTSYFRNYYSSPPSGYSKPQYINGYDGMTYRAANGNLYLIICFHGMGDVYQLQAGDSISPTNDGAKGTVNANAPFAPNTVFYGDPVQFTGKTASQNVASISWNFGNPEAGTANSTQVSGPNAPILYQYSNLTKTTLGSKTVSATSVTDANVKGSVAVSLQTPAARFGIAGALPLRFLFAAPNASSPAPIIAGDSFVDASDGTVESHYVSWTLDGTTTTAAPGTPISVGQCGSHSLVFQTYYGPHSNVNGVFSTLPSPAANFIVGLDPANPANSTFNYIAKPFAAVIDILGGDATNLNFSGANSRGITSPTIVAASGFTWTWDVINSAGITIFGPVSGVGPTIQNFAVPKQTFVNQPNLQARLTLKTVAPLTGTCSGLETTVATTTPLNAPNPKITPTGDGVNVPYTFTASSLTGADTTGWTYAWTVNGAAPDNVNVSASGGTTSSTFSPTFLKAGTYQIGVTATNPIASAPATPVSVTIQVAACAKLGIDSFMPTFSGAACSSAPGSPACTSGEPVTFNAQLNFYAKKPYSPNCSTTTYTWTFPSGAVLTSVDPQVSVTYNVTGSGTVTLKVTNTTGDSFTYPVSLTVGTAGGGCTVNCGGGTPPPCTGMGPANIYYSVAGATCTSPTACGTNDLLTFTLQPYLFDTNCIKLVTWSFGDGQTAPGPIVTHKYTADGSHPGSVTVTDSTGEIVTKPVPVTTSASTGGNPGGGSCGAVTPNVTLSINYANASGSCGPLSGPCSAGEALSFSVLTYQYDIGCATHTYDWDFGDNTAHSSSAAPTHQYGAAGTYHAVCVVNNGTAYRLTQDVKIGSGGIPVTGNVQPTITVEAIANVPNGYTFQAHFDHPEFVSTWTWNFGDGTTRAGKGTAANPNPEGYIYLDNKKYTVTLTAYGSSGQPIGTDNVPNEPTIPPKSRAVRIGPHH